MQSNLRDQVVEIVFMGLLLIIMLLITAYVGDWALEAVTTR